MVHQSLLHGMQLSVHGQVSGGGHFQAMCGMRHAYATVDTVRVAVIGSGQHHRACATVAAGATFFGVGGTQLFS